MTTALLAGPILRRVTPNRVCVWLAARRPLKLKLQILAAKSAEILGESKSDDAVIQSCQLGDNLFVYLLQARYTQNKPFPCDELLYYRIIELLATGEKSVWDLTSLAYGDLPHPSFFIPSRLQRLLHGSCRKPHGSINGELDALGYGDDLLQTTHADLNLRPALLLLTGNQIYADDVAIALLAMLRQQAQALLGEESLPVTAEWPKLQGRQAFLKAHKSGFSSENADNHLFSFGEYAAMYLYVFGNVQQWQLPDAWEFVSAAGVADPAAAEDAFNAQREALSNFHARLGKVRKLFANIPTYMLFDDHDVTGDWNITSDWYDRVRDSALGRRIVANALAAYWAFQGWGNDPDNFDKDLQLSIFCYLADRNGKSEIGARYDLHLWKYRGWSFSVPTDPPIIAIDSRTRRTATPDSYLPVLVDRYGLDWLRVEWAKLQSNQAAASTCWPIIIAPEPVFGFSILEKMQKVMHGCAEQLENDAYFKGIEILAGLKRFLTQKVIRFVAAEAWTSNRESFNSLIACLAQRMKITQCVFLSGNVNYSFSALGKHLHPAKKGENGYAFRAYQLTCAPLSNAAGEAQQRAIAKASRFSDGVTQHTSRWKTLFPQLPFEAPETLVHLLPSQATASRVSSRCHLGLLQLEQGQPQQHVLLHGGNDSVYRLPESFERLSPAARPPSRAPENTGNKPDTPA
ncbi:MAG: hypothetical protein ACU837_08685 [Gammaproteobacteria bacterium]